MTSIPDVSWSRIVSFVRQHTHDLRNELNGLDLEAALLADIVKDPEALDSVGRIRSEIRKVAGDLRVLSSKFADPSPTLLRLAASELFLIWQDQQATLQSPLDIEWTSHFADEQVNVDPSAVAQAFRELLANARAFNADGKLRAAGYVSGDRVIFELREPKVNTIDPARWGRSPFETAQRGRYGLGLCALLKGVEANGGAVTWMFDSPARELVTSVSFPTA